ncbi:MAG TPA: hypothetical protein DEO84_04695, partial [candidate division Zixibacteria bacterium]|nr:hypothetical protein [candidate division Zixibacteria bacterium]
MKTVTNLKWIRLLAWTAVGILIISSPAMALTNYIFYSVNGDTTGNDCVQGDIVSWGANCGIGATIGWELWLDVNSNTVIDSLTDVLIVSFDCTDGDTANNQGLPDINPVPDGWFITPPLTLGIAAGHYVFRATDRSDNSIAIRGLIVSSMPSPPNQFRGRVMVQGHPAPDSYLQNIWIEAKPQGESSQIWSGLTDVNGLYEINISDVGTGFQYEINPRDLPGYVTPASQLRTASGIIDSINFAYIAPTDSLYGEIRDNNGDLITRSVYVYCSPRTGGQSREVQTNNGSYRLYFGPSDYGQWGAGLSNENLVPDYLLPNTWDFDNSTIHSLHHDFICFSSDTVLYARVTENHNQPLHEYLLQAQSNALNCWTMAVSGIGASNLVTLSISSLDLFNWGVNISNWDDRYPIPPGYVLEGGQSWNHHPGDTVSMNFIFGKMVRDTVKLDPGDPPINMNMLWVNLNRPGASYGAQPDNNGVFTIYADTGFYSMGLYRNGYLTDPSGRDVHVVDDTVGGLGFVINQAHCLVTGALIDVPLPLDFSVSVNAHTGSGCNNYCTWAMVDSITGTFAIWLCDGNWTIDPPSFPNRITPVPMTLNILESPDTSRSFNFVYLNPEGVNEKDNSIPEKFVIFQNNPNPFNAQTTIDYGVPMTSNVRIEVYDLLGRKLETLRDGEQQAGYYKVIWNAGNRPSGIYFYSLKVGDFSQTRKMLL